MTFYEIFFTALALLIFETNKLDSRKKLLLVGVAYIYSSTLVFIIVCFIVVCRILSIFFTGR
jgi:hypothetical protein